MRNVISFVFVLTLISTSAFAHSGRTNSSGCHHDRKNGGYHCHKAKDNSEIKQEVKEVAVVDNSEVLLKKK